MRKLLMVALILLLGLLLDADNVGVVPILLGVNAALVGIVAYFLKMGIDAVREALSRMHQQDTTLALHGDAILRHERALEKLLEAT